MDLELLGTTHAGYSLWSAGDGRQSHIHLHRGTLPGLGIGANTAIYSFMDAILMRSLPVQHPEQLVVLSWRAKDSPTVIHGQNGSQAS